MTTEAATGSERREAAIARLQAELAALLPHASPAGARIAIAPPRASYAPVWDSFQGYARPLWAMAALARSGDAGRLDPVIWQRWRQGLIAGTDPGHPEYWGPCEDLCQAFCEMPPLALALCWAAGELWHPLDPLQRDRVLDWLAQITERAVHDNNWRWFRVLVALVLDQLGHGDHRDGIDKDLAALDDHHVDAGWYHDGRHGRSCAADGYIPNAYHCYGLLVAELLGHRRPALARRLRERARRFARDFRFFTASDGAPILWGRSCCYREAWTALWAAAALTDTELLPWPELAGLWRRQQHWWNARPLRRSDGCLDLGCTYPNPAACEPYIAATSPYWSMKGLLGLAAPASHPFWAAPAMVPPRREHAVPLPGCGGLLAGDADDPLLLLVGQYAPPWLPGGSSRYGRFAYAAHHGVDLLPAGDQPPVDNSLLIREAAGPWLERQRPLAWRVDGRTASVAWSPAPWIRVRTTLSPIAGGYRRVHRIDSDRAIETCEGGFALPPGQVRHEAAGLTVTSAGLFSHIRAEDDRQAELCGPRAAGNLLHPTTVVPVLRGRLPAGHHRLACVCLIRLPNEPNQMLAGMFPP